MDILTRCMQLLADPGVTRLDYFAATPDAPLVAVGEGTLGVAWSALPSIHAAAWGALSAAPRGTTARWDAASCLLLAAPFNYTAWGALRERALAALAGGAAAAPATLASELRFARLVHSRHPKSGEGWAFRRWLVGRAVEASLRDGGGSGRDALVALLSAELDACAAAAERRPRLYYAWTHRGIVARGALRLLLQAGAAGGSTGSDSPLAPSPTTWDDAQDAAVRLLRGQLDATAHRVALLDDASAAHYRATLLGDALDLATGRGEGAVPSLHPGVVVAVAQLALQEAALAAGLLLGAHEAHPPPQALEKGDADEEDAGPSSSADPVAGRGTPAHVGRHYHAWSVATLLLHSRLLPAVVALQQDGGLGDVNALAAQLRAATAACGGGAAAVRPGTFMPPRAWLQGATAV